MSTHAFTPKHGPIIIEAEVTGPRGTTQLDLALDTGATTSLIKLATILYLGFDPNQPLRRLRMTTGNAAAIVPVYALTRLTALGQDRFVFPVIGYPWPSSSGVDGLLGLDFLRDQIVTIDFRAGQIKLS